MLERLKLNLRTSLRASSELGGGSQWCVQMTGHIFRASERRSEEEKRAKHAHQIFRASQLLLPRDFMRLYGGIRALSGVSSSSFCLNYGGNTAVTPLPGGPELRQRAWKFMLTSGAWFRRRGAWFDSVCSNQVLNYLQPESQMERERAGVYKQIGWREREGKKKGER